MKRLTGEQVASKLWGPSPLPLGARIVGAHWCEPARGWTIKLDDGRAVHGWALIKLEDGRIVEGRAGAFRDLLDSSGPSVHRLARENEEVWKIKAGRAKAKTKRLALYERVQSYLDDYYKRHRSTWSYNEAKLSAIKKFTKTVNGKKVKMVGMTAIREHCHNPAGRET